VNDARPWPKQPPSDRDQNPHYGIGHNYYHFAAPARRYGGDPGSPQQHKQRVAEPTGSLVLGPRWPPNAADLTASPRFSIRLSHTRAMATADRPNRRDIKLRVGQLFRRIRKQAPLTTSSS